MKKKLIIILSLVMCLAIATAGGTMAYFGDKKAAHNVITMGEINIDVVEQQAGPDGVLVDYPDKPIKVIPTSEVSKIVTVKNSAEGVNTDAWIRVKIKKTISGDLSTDCMKLDIDTENWVQSGDWYYYKKAIAPNESTTPLLNKVSFEQGMGNAYQGSEANITICAQAVQAANNPAPNGDVTQIAGWPAEE